jgi:hypothetical protein
MLKIIYQPQAEAELLRAASFYSLRNSAAGAAFLAAYVFWPLPTLAGIPLTGDGE